MYPPWMVLVVMAVQLCSCCLWRVLWQVYFCGSMFVTYLMGSVLYASLLPVVSALLCFCCRRRRLQALLKLSQLDATRSMDLNCCHAPVVS